MTKPKRGGEGTRKAALLGFWAGKRGRPSRPVMGEGGEHVGGIVGARGPYKGGQG